MILKRLYKSTGTFTKLINNPVLKRFVFCLKGLADLVDNPGTALQFGEVHNKWRRRWRLAGFPERQLLTLASLLRIMKDAVQFARIPVLVIVLIGYLFFSYDNKHFSGYSHQT